MLIHWEWSEDELQKADQNILRNATAELMRACRKGYHLASISRTTSAWLIKHVDLSSAEKSQLESIAKSFAQVGALKRRAKFYIEVSAIDHDFERIDNKSKVSIRYLSESRLLEPSSLIVENIDHDGRIFSTIFDIAKRYAGISNLSMQIVHGGGGDVIRVLSQTISEKKICCLIIDSDKHHPKYKKSKSLAESEKITRDTNYSFCFIDELPCRELENIIPIEVVRQCQCALGHTGLTLIDAITAAEAAQNCDKGDRYWLWFDIKEGIKEEKLQKMDAKTISWHSTKLMLAGLNVGSLNVTGFGKNVVSQVLSNGDLMSRFVFAIKSEEWKTLFMPMFTDHCWIFMGQNPSRT